MEKSFENILQKHLERKVLQAIISNGTAVGDNFLSVIHSIDATVQTKNGKDQEVLHLFLKMYPTHPSRRQYNNEMNIFYTEMASYKYFIPKLKDMARKCGHEDVFMRIFAPFIAGDAQDFSVYNYEDLQKCMEKPFEMWDQFILMEDVRKAMNYKMYDRQKSLDVDHFRQVMETLAKLHSSSWAYKVKNGIDSFEQSEFSFLKFKIRPEVKKIWEGMVGDSIIKSLGVLETQLGKDSDVYKGTQKTLDFMMEVVLTYFENVCEKRKNMDKFFRIPPKKDKNEIPWNVVIHGDCWVNNFLFRYDEITSKPTDAILVDLQFTRETCPTVDMNYLIYSSTDAEFRENHLDSMLQHYHDSFNKNCSLLGVETLPGFSFEEIKMRVHRTKLYGYILAMLLLPLFLQDSSKAKDMETMEEGADMSGFFSDASGNNLSDTFTTRIIEVAKEMYRDGII